MYKIEYFVNLRELFSFIILMACFRYLVEMYLHGDIALNSDVLNVGQLEIYLQK